MLQLRGATPQTVSGSHDRAKQEPESARVKIQTLRKCTKVNESSRELEAKIKEATVSTSMWCLLFQRGWVSMPDLNLRRFKLFEIEGTRAQVYFDHELSLTLIIV